MSKTKLETLKSQTLEKAITRPRKACLFHLSSTEPQMISRFLTSHSTLRVPSAIREPVHDLENLVMRNVCLHHARNQFERKLFMSQNKTDRISLLKTFFFCTNHRGQRVVSVVRFVTHIQCLLHHLVQRNPSQMTNCLCFRQQNTVSKSFPFYLSQVRSNPIAPPLDVLNVIVISKLLAQICRS